MLNQVILVGRLVRDPEVIESENGKSYSQITLAAPRSFKNSEGQYDTDFIDCVTWENVAKSTAEYCKKGDIIGVKGRMQSLSFEDKEGNKQSKLEVVAEKVTFLSSRETSKNKEDQER